MMKMEHQVYEVLNVLESMPPKAYASVKGSTQFPDINGMVRFYSMWDGSLVVADIEGLPYTAGDCKGRIFGFHIHEGARCLGTVQDPFAQTQGHYNPQNCAHPEHAGDLPPLFGNHGDALQIFYTDRFFPEGIVDHTVVIHDMPDDFKSQPSGDSGMKIACGEIQANNR